MGSRRLRRYAGVVRLAGARVRHRLGSGGSRQTFLAVVGVALAVALLLTVTSVGLGLESQGTVRTASADYWIVPEESQGSAVTGVESTRLGQVHSVSTSLEERDDVAYATPVLFDLLQVRTDADSDPTRVFVIGIIPNEEAGSVIGLSTSGLTPGDPYYANGRYNGTWSGEAVVSASAAETLQVDTGDTIRPTARRGGDSDQTFRVVETSSAQAPGIAQFPVLVVHLSEAQQLVGAARGDEANQILVDTTAPSARDALTGIYPQSEVVSRSGLFAHDLQSSDLPYAMSIAAGIIALLVGGLTIITTTGFEVADDAESRAVLAAMGVSTATRSFLVAAETLVTALIGGILGVTIWLVSTLIINVVGRDIASVPLAVLRPELAVYGLVAALVVGLASLPILVVFLNRGPLTEALPTQ